MKTFFRFILFSLAVAMAFFVWSRRAPVIIEPIEEPSLANQIPSGLREREEVVQSEVGGLPEIDELDRSDKNDTSDRSDMIDRAASILLDVPFQPQAPFADWRPPFAESCEEAALVLANRYARGLPTLSREEMRDEILKLVEFQNTHYGDYKDSDAQRSAEIGKEVYGLNLEVKKVKEVNEVKEIFEEGKLVIAPMAGRELRNPYFTPPGPLYHMLVIRGFDEARAEFITNDVGTRRGEALRYPYETLWDAIHDFPGSKERILEGEKRIIVVARSP